MAEAPLNVDSSSNNSPKTLNKKLLDIVNESGIRVWSFLEYVEVLQDSRVASLCTDVLLLSGDTFHWVVKFVREDLAYRFEAEVIALCHLRHTKGVQIIEAVCLETDHLMVVSQYAGETLLSVKNHLTRSQADQVVAQVYAIVRRVHDRGFVHSDLHLENICVEFDGSGGVVVTIIDFGDSSTLYKAWLYRNIDLDSCFQLQSILSFVNNSVS